MSALEAVLRRQQTLGETVEKAIGKDGKAGGASKTEIYYHRRIEEVDTWWKEFEDNDKVIMASTNTDDGRQAYVANKYYETIKKCKDTFRTKLVADGTTKFPSATFAKEGDQITTTEMDEEEDDEDLEAPRSDVIFNSTSKHNETHSSKQTRKKKNAEKLYEVRAAALNEAAAKLATKSDDDLSEVEIEFDLKKLENLLQLYSAAYEERMLVAANDIETEGMRIESEDLTNIAERTILLFRQKQAEARQKRAAQPEALKLKPLKVPRFTGNYQEWAPFVSLFTTVVHNNEKLDNIQRMQYLLDCLEGEPRRIIQHLDLTRKNYDAAIEILTRRYNDERRIINKHLDDILDHPAIGDDVKGLKSLVDLTKESLYAIENQGINEKRLGKVLLARIIEKKLDIRTRRFFESTLTNKREIPKFGSMMEFLEDRFVGMESITTDGERNNQNKTTGGNKNSGSNTTNNRRNNCSICHEQHRIHQCPKYNGMTPYERYEAVKKARLCRNCLGNHEANKCSASGSCVRCSKFHHTSLHYERTRDTTERAGARAHIAKNEGPDYDVLLATAMIQAQNEDGKYIELRALIDQGSTATFISEDAVQRLRVKRTKNTTTITGIGATDAGKSQGCSNIKLKPRYPSSFNVSVEALIMRKLTSFAPGNLTGRQWNHTNGLVLADPNYDKPGKIDIILGADIFGTIVLSGVIRGPPDTPVAQETEFGWILSGRWDRRGLPVTAVGLISNAQIEKRLEAFWTIEDVPEKIQSKMTSDEVKCEEFFQKTYRRNEHGQYITRLPFKTTEFCMGKSRNIAVATLLQMEKKFQRNPEWKAEYAKCINEYLELGHMELAKNSDESLVTMRNNEKHYNCYYLPHHAVIKASSTTTKLRVVFNASQKTTNGVSLNDVMLIGPTIQDDLLDILLRWRKHRIAVTADIEKMYRQFFVDEADVDYQRIVWRNSENEPIRDYRIKRIFFGNASAPFMAIRSVKQLAYDERARFPKAAEVTERDFYVDDLITGTHTVKEAQELQHELRQLMQSGRLNLRKWATNASECLKGIPDEHCEIKGDIEINNATIKMLGVQWNPGADEFTYHVNLGEEKKEYSKRNIVSEVAQLFDPLGWLAPVVILAKIQLQELWVAGLDWDETVPQQIDEKWRNYRRTLHNLESIGIPRYVGLGFEDAKYQMHGFCDASEKAYAAAVYLRCVFQTGQVKVNLLVAKSRVAPTRTITIPKLELCGALLLANLMAKVNSALKMQLEMHAWTDSMITLAWIHGNAQRWETFVANRVSKIQGLVESKRWRHVGTKENPADAASRGLNAVELRECGLWWNGPSWLSQKELNMGEENIKDTTVGAKKSHALTAHCETDYQQTIQRFSSYSKAIRVVAYCRRFMLNCRAKNTEKQTGLLSISELRTAEGALIQWAQKNDFAEEMRSLEANQGLDPKSPIKALNPFLEKGVLRVRGRIQSDNLPHARKYPIIMAYGNRLTTLIIEDAHKKTLHGGNQLTLAFIRHKFWIMKAKRAVKAVVRKCITCFKYRAQTQQQQMGSLPVERTTESRPFTNTGVDFCGPFDIKNMVGRGCRTTKGYVAIFICMATKAIHIEVVSNLTSEAFIAALKRMIGRRGAVAHMFSDNGTNFVGANKIIQAEYRAFQKEYNDELTMELTKLGMEWHFNPPSAPHFGGLWEAGVKSIKHHLKRVVGDVKLTYEELATVLCQIEACLNSRPLYPLTEDPDDLRVLTPGHFLIGEAPTMPPETNYELKTTSRLTRWQLCAKLHQDIWRVWKDEYLSRLQQRTKWINEKENIRTGDMVLVKDERTPSSTWPLGRITETHKGGDGLVRVVDVRIGKKTYRRPITKICLLPTEDNQRSVAAGKDDEAKSSSGKLLPISTTLATILILLLGLVAAATGNMGIQIHPFQNNTIAYVEGIGEAQIVHGDWKLLIFYDLSTYFYEFDRINEGLLQWERACSRAQHNCSTVSAQFVHRVRGIRDKNELLTHDFGETRMKRQIGLAIGSVALGGAGAAVYKWLTTHEANEYAQTIDELKTNQIHTMTLLRNQTSVLELTANIIKQTTREMDLNHEMLKNRTQKLAEASAKNEMNWHLHDIALHYSLMLENYADTQNYLIDAITTAHDGHLHPLLVTPAKINEQTKVIRQQLDPGLELPPSTTHIYQLAGVRTRLTGKKLIFQVSIPILKTTPFRIWRIIPVPRRTDEGTTEIRPTAEFILADNSSHTYYGMTMSELQGCQHMNDRRICRTRRPMRKVGSTENRCEIEILRNGTDVETKCIQRAATSEERWVQLNDVHSWIYALDGEQKFNASCGKDRYEIALSYNGLVRVHGNCSIDGKTVQIATSQLTTQLNTGYLVSSTVAVNLTHPAQMDNIKINHTSTTGLDTAIEKLKRKMAEELPNISLHDWHQYGLIYGLIGTAIIIYVIRQPQRTGVSHAGFIIRASGGARENVRE